MAAAFDDENKSELGRAFVAKGSSLTSFADEAGDGDAPRYADASRYADDDTGNFGDGGGCRRRRFAEGADADEAPRRRRADGPRVRWADGAAEVVEFTVTPYLNPEQQLGLIEAEAADAREEEAERRRAAGLTPLVDYDDDDDEDVDAEAYASGSKLSAATV